ncbi:ABC-type multidrug transport system fused ATPase/permease subunit [Bradyrhizobium sp. i1.4.4]
MRKVTRGMWALDLLNDTILMALAPSLLVLIGSMILLGVHWASLGAVIAFGALAYVTMMVLFSTRYIAPAARVSNAWDTKVGGTLADALTCNAVVKSFGAEAREDARFARVINRWRVRVRRTWLRYNHTNLAQLSVLLALRASVIGGAVLLWMSGRASPGDVTYVLTSYYVIHAYLRDVGMHINNLQRSVNDMEELVAIHDEPIGIADAPDGRPIAIERGELVFDDVTFHYGGHHAPLYDGLSVTIRAGERVGLVGRSGSGKTTFVKMVQRLYDVTGGRVLIDGQDIAEATQHSLRSQIAIVQQDPILFHRSLAENIAYGRPGASLEAIEQAGTAGQRARLHPAPAQGLRHDGRRARRQALRRRAAARGASARLPGRRAGADSGRSDLEPRFGIRSTDPAGDGAADERPDLDRDRAPVVDGEEPRSHPGVRPRRDRRAGHPCRARGEARRHLSNPVRVPND